MRALFDQSAHTEWYIFDDGRVYYEKDGYTKKLKPCINKSRGYMYVRTTNKNFIIHRLVASAFLPNPENKPEVNHIDGDKTNNKLENLEWLSHKENMVHALKNGLITKMKKNEGNLKYTNEQCKDVMERVRSGMKYEEAGSIYDMPYSTVAHLIRGSRRAV